MTGVQTCALPIWDAIHEQRFGKDGVLYCTCHADRFGKASEVCKHLEAVRLVVDRSEYDGTQSRRLVHGIDLLMLAGMEEGELHAGLVVRAMQGDLDPYPQRRRGRHG